LTGSARAFLLRLPALSRLSGEPQPANGSDGWECACRKRH